MLVEGLGRLGRLLDDNLLHRLSKPSTFQQSPVTGQNASTSSPGVMDLLQGSLTRYIINATNPIYLRPARYRPTVASTPAPTPSSQLYMLAYTHLPIHPLTSHLSSFFNYLRVPHLFYPTTSPYCMILHPSLPPSPSPPTTTTLTTVPR